MWQLKLSKCWGEENETERSTMHRERVEWEMKTSTRSHRDSHLTLVEIQSERPLREVRWECSSTHFVPMANDWNKCATIFSGNRADFLFIAGAGRPSEHIERNGIITIREPFRVLSGREECLPIKICFFKQKPKKPNCFITKAIRFDLRSTLSID